ncbi:unnamed protein product (macronuclear) [Paramecium tetraurelia]|uniref:Uncharacterized protein n=2 Tax=Paramecium TaxID=5884 RepID=A0CLI7_PARTE|nr:uncharacterized protein GSPATT00008202001 [Paramecium tetraurelia]CAD8159596.1 unnamed protein product [Paramecium octaurelia]CAK71654.1 unnamed protein product [Paramecium tetraurelia]|eukprot:XP_001439051.1 hypothetical protein (macronuclear) [Paramecium tetraurelia strain d4-2]
MSSQEQEIDKELDQEQENGGDQEDQEEQDRTLSGKKKQPKKYERITEGLSNRKPGQKFTPEEDRLILELVQSIGPKFQKIHKHFPGKTLAMVKNRYYKYLRYRWEVLDQQNNITEQNKETNKQNHHSNESYEILCEKQKKISSLLHQERNDLVNSIAQRASTPNAKIFVEYLIDQML